MSINKIIKELDYKKIMKEILKTIYDALDDKKANNIVILDISEISEITDYFVICSGSNQNQVQAISDNVEEELAKKDIKGKKIEGFKNAEWILMDYSDFVIHIFSDEQREFYGLEKIWSDAKRVEVYTSK